MQESRSQRYWRSLDRSMKDGSSHAETQQPEQLELFNEEDMSGKPKAQVIEAPVLSLQHSTLKIV